MILNMGLYEGYLQIRKIIKSYHRLVRDKSFKAEVIQCINILDVKTFGNLLICIANSLTYVGNKPLYH